MNGKQMLQVTADIGASTSFWIVGCTQFFTHFIFIYFLLNKQYHSVLYHVQLFIWDLILRLGKD